MPAEGSKQFQREQRKSSRKTADDIAEGSHVREIELKRSRGEISCAECRRLKIKCDKKLPCSSCLRRGCAALCPNGSLSTGQGTRFVMAATDHLHRRMAKMSERIRQLEDALTIIHKRQSDSDEPHPLLREEFLLIKAHKADESPEDRLMDNSNDDTGVIDAFGTLSITDRGTSHFFGAAGGTESLLQDGEDQFTTTNSSSRYSSPSMRSSTTGDSISISSSKSPSLPPDISRFSSAFPFTPMGPHQAIRELIRGYLPPYDRALSLTNTYLNQAAWLFHAISRTQLIDEMLPTIYRKQPPPDPAHSYSGPHDLALLYMVFSVGALVDLTQEPYNAEAEHFYQLAKAAICLQSVLETPELTTIQALHLMSIYNAMSQNDKVGSETSMEFSWSLIRLSMQLSQIIGLHRDSSRWGLNPRDVQRRRALFWDLFVAEVWEALSTGRPPSITTPYFDCKFPTDDDQGIDEGGTPESGYINMSSWSFRFASECVAEVAAKTLTAQVPTYQTILELDRVVRDFPIPELPAEMPFDPTRPAMTMTRYVLSHSREVILLCIHRSFFAQAMIDDPVDPLRSPFAPSFLAAYRCASHILLSIKEQFDLLPELCSRFWSTWTYAFSAAVVFGTIVTRGPSSDLAHSSLAELDQACTLFAKAAIHSRRAAKALGVLRKLQTKAHQAYEMFLKVKAMPTADKTSIIQTPQDETEDELAIFGGRTRLVGPKTNSNKSSPSPGSSFVLSPMPSQSDVVLRPEHRVPSQINTTGYSHTPQVMPEGMSDWTSPTSTTNQRHFFTQDGTFMQPPIPSRLDTATPSYNTVTQSRDDKMSWSTAPPQINPTARSLPPRQAQSQSQGQGQSQFRALSVPNPNPMSEEFRQAYPTHYHTQHSSPIQQSPIHHQQHYPGYFNPPQTQVEHSFQHQHQQQNQHQHQHQHQQHQHQRHEPPYAPAPREFAEMGLASQGSGLNQQWTSFMHDSGVFYEHQI